MPEETLETKVAALAYDIRALQSDFKAFRALLIGVYITIIAPLLVLSIGMGLQKK